MIIFLIAVTLISRNGTGIVEVLFNTIWKRICGDSFWDDRAASGTLTDQPGRDFKVLGLHSWTMQD